MCIRDSIESGTTYLTNEQVTGASGNLNGAAAWTVTPRVPGCLMAPQNPNAATTCEQLWTFSPNYPQATTQEEFMGMLTGEWNLATNDGSGEFIRLGGNTLVFTEHSRLSARLRSRSTS